MFLFELEDGMVIGEDLLTSSGIMILPAGVVVTQPIREHLESLGVDCVTIDPERKPETYEQHVNDEHFKVFNKEYVEAKNRLNDTFDRILDKNISKEDVSNMIDESWKMINKGYNTYNVMNMLYAMHDFSDSTYMHCMNVGMIAALLGKWLGWSEEDQRVLNACGMFHDIGKLVTPKSVLDKPGKLTSEEYEIMKLHTVKGYELLKDMDIDPRIINATIMHHERVDGSGYPLKIKGDKIDRFSKVIAIADVYEAMTANRVYRGPMCPFDVIAQFEATGFGIYETKYLVVFLQNIVDTYLHSKVELSDGEHAEVVLINRQQGSRPIVLTTTGRSVDLSRETNIKISNVF